MRLWGAERVQTPEGFITTLHELDRLEEEMRGAIAPHRLEFDEDASVGTELHAVLGERGAEEVAAELFKAGAIVRGHPDVGVEGPQTPEAKRKVTQNALRDAFFTQRFETIGGHDPIAINMFSDYLETVVDTFHSVAPVDKLRANRLALLYYKRGHDPRVRRDGRAHAQCLAPSPRGAIRSRHAPS